MSTENRTTGPTNVSELAKACWHEMEASTRFPIKTIARHMAKLAAEKDVEIAEASAYKAAWLKEYAAQKCTIAELEAYLARHVAALRVATDALKDAERTSLNYATMHMAKTPPDKIKADRNKDVADQITIALQRIDKELKP